MVGCYSFYRSTTNLQFRVKYKTWRKVGIVGTRLNQIMGSRVTIYTGLIKHVFDVCLGLLPTHTLPCFHENHLFVLRLICHEKVPRSFFPPKGCPCARLWACSCGNGLRIKRNGWPERYAMPCGWHFGMFCNMCRLTFNRMNCFNSHCGDGLSTTGQRRVEVPQLPHHHQQHLRIRTILRQLRQVQVF